MSSDESKGGKRKRRREDKPNKHSKKQKHSKSKKTSKDKRSTSHKVDWSQVDSVVELIISVFPESKKNLFGVFETLDNGDAVQTAGIVDRRMKDLLEDVFGFLGLHQSKDGSFGSKHGLSLSSKYSWLAEQKKYSSDDEVLEGPLVPGAARAVANTPDVKQIRDFQGDTQMQLRLEEYNKRFRSKSLITQHQDRMPKTTSKKFSWDRERDLLGGFKIDKRNLERVAHDADQLGSKFSSSTSGRKFL